MIACRYGHISIIEWLVSHNIPHEDMIRSSAFLIVTAIHASLADSCRCGCLIPLIWVHDCMYGVDKADVSPFHMACSQGHVSIMEWLVDHGIPTQEILRTSKIWF